MWDMEDNEHLEKQWDKEITTDTIKDLKATLSKHFIFFSLSEELLLKIISDMFFVEVEDN